jgi:propionyl-CoA synthetase
MGHIDLALVSSYAVSFGLNEASLIIIGSIEQAVSSYPTIAECCVVGIPDSLKGHLPFAFATLSTPDHPTSAIPSDALSAGVLKLVRSQIGAIASLGGMTQGEDMIPKTQRRFAAYYES